MRTLFKIIIITLLIAAPGYLGFTKLGEILAERNRPKYRMATVDKGDIRLSVNASGEVNPVLSVKIGSFVSGPIDKLHVDFNQEVKKGDLLAEIDSRIYDASVARDEAALATRVADVERVKAELQKAINDEKRSIALKSENQDFISQAEMDQYRFARQAMEAQLQVAEAGVKQAKANLENSQANVGYTRIVSPVDGIVIDRKIDPGQTLAAQFQTPELFTIAPDLRAKVHIFASVDEADIGRLKKAQETKQPVFFRVDAYPEEVFDKGYIEQIRLGHKVNQNVVTYPVIVASENPDLKLLPGMTAMITFQVSELKDVLKVPNAALRYYPEKTHVRESDQHLLDLNLMPEADGESKATSSLTPPVDDTARAVVAATKRIVWVQETTAEAEEAARRKAESEEVAVGVKNTDESVSSESNPATSEPVVAQVAKEPAPADVPVYSGKLKAVHVVIGESDYRFTHVISGELKPGDQVIVGIKPPGAP
ncbi:MAG: efflux RND transporter periplasmic adaptor subunit [Planctomycetota bacterium]